MITGKTLIDMGYKQGPWFGEAIARANHAEAVGMDIRASIESAMPPPYVPLRKTGLPYFLNIRAEDALEADNIAKVEETMRELMRVPTVVSGAVMPDACPAGEICVGGVVATKEAIHPGYHSADICCSMGISVLGDVDPRSVLDVGMGATHFGYGGRRDPIEVPASVVEAFEANSYLLPIISIGARDFASQGDGNHFFYVGTLKSTGETALVTHHGSRGPGAALYKAGMVTAERMRASLSPDTPKGSAWIPSETKEGEAYWEALQTIGKWTKASHFAIHDLVASRLNVTVKDRWWNEHNFVFRRSDGLFYHAKGATPGWSDYSLTLVPLNMAEPVLVTRGRDAPNGLGFLPHGAGRNMSRTQHFRNLGVEFKSDARGMSPRDQQIVFDRETQGIDARFYAGKMDLSELPSAYKNAATVRSQITEYKLADVVDEILPYGTIMAGELEQFWRKKKPIAPLCDTEVRV